MSWYKRRFEHSLNLWENKTTDIELELMELLDQELLEARSYRFHIHDLVQIINAAPSSGSWSSSTATTTPPEIGTVKDRHVKISTMDATVVVTYTVEMNHDHSIRRLNQDDVQAIPFLHDLNSIVHVNVTTDKNNDKNIQGGIIVARTVKPNAAFQLVRSYTIEFDKSFSSKLTSKNVTEITILGQSAPTVVSLPNPNMDSITLKKTLLTFAQQEHPTTTATSTATTTTTTTTTTTPPPPTTEHNKYTFSQFPQVRLKKRDTDIKDVFIELLEIYAMSTKATTTRKTFQVSSLMEHTEGIIGESYTPEEIVTENVLLHQYIHRTIQNPHKITSKKSSGSSRTCYADLQTNALDAVVAAPEVDTSNSNNEKAEVTKAIPIATVTNASTAARNKKHHRIKDTVHTLKLRPSPPGGWKWPCLAPRRSLRVQLDVFVDNTTHKRHNMDHNDNKTTKNPGVDEGNSSDDEEEDDTDRERTFSTEISVDEPLESILHFFKCWYVFDDDHSARRATAKQTDEQSTSSRHHFGDHIELFINIRTHSSEQVLRIDTMNATSHAILRTKIASAWTILHKSGSQDMGLCITISARCQYIYIIPALCVSVRVHDREFDPLMRVNMPVGVSLVHARQLITDCTIWCNDFGNDDSDDESSEATGGLGNQPHQEWRELQTLAVSNDYTFSRQGASVLKSVEHQVAALQLSVIEGSRVFHQHSQSEELSLVCIPSL